MNLRPCSLPKLPQMYGLFRTISSEIEHLNQSEAKEKEKEKEEEECVICMGSINNEINESFTTHCNHVFHKDCLSRWCQQNNSCPSCRTINVLPCQAQCLPGDSSNSLIRDSPFYHILENEYWQGPDTTPPRSGRPYFNNIINNNYNNNINNNNYNNININNNYTGLINAIDNININENNINENNN
jgi:hypothetical protein